MVGECDIKENLSIPTTPVSSFGSVSEFMGSWIQCSPLCWSRVYRTSPLLENQFSVASKYCSYPESLNPCTVLSLTIQYVDWCVFSPSLYYFNFCVHFLCFFYSCYIDPVPFQPFCMLWLKLQPFIFIIVSQLCYTVYINAYNRR